MESLGIIDKDGHRWPVLENILATCKQAITLEDFNTFTDNFKYLLEITNEEGHISEQHFDLCGFRPDIDINGNVVPRLATIMQESYQRAKNMTHEHQIERRHEHIRSNQAKGLQKKEAANLRHQ